MRDDGDGPDRPGDDLILETAAAGRPAPPPMLRAATEADAPAIAAILNREIAETTASWSTSPRGEADVAALIGARRSAGYPVLVAASDPAPPVGYAALAPFRNGEGYAGCAETSVYVAASARGRGLGDALLRGLLRRARRRGMRALAAAIGADNGASIALHAKHGFVEAGRLPGIGRKFDRDLDLLLLLKRL